MGQSIIKTDLPDIMPGVLGIKNQQKSVFSAEQGPLGKG
jgi:hypothetical protein